MVNIQKVAVIGSGIMGHGIAQVTATAGMAVRLNDLSQELLDKAQTRIARSLDKGVQRGKIAEADKGPILERIRLCPDMAEAVEGADLVVEAAPENLGVKQEIFAFLESNAPAAAVLASNTSQYSITTLAAELQDPSRVVGMHWFNPPVIMKLIELVRGLLTSDQAMERVQEFCRRVGKEVVVCRDSQGFISTRVLLALRAECYRLYEEGVASKEDIDKTLRLAFGHPMGQFELADYSGLDIEVTAFDSLTRVFGDRFRPPQQLSQLVKAGRLGRKSGQGWYSY